MKTRKYINKHECNQIYKKGKNFFMKYLIIKKTTKNKEITRYGISIPKKNFKKAVTRNKIRRQIRSILNEKDFEDGDYLIIVKKNYNFKKDFKILKKEILLFNYQ